MKFVKKYFFDVWALLMEERSHFNARFIIKTFVKTSSNDMSTIQQGTKTFLNKYLQWKL